MAMWEEIDRDGYDGVHGGHGLGVRNEEGIKIMDFATAYQMRLMNTYYKKRENHLVTYNNGGRRSQIDFIMLRKEYTKECKNCKVLPKEAITTQHRVLIAEFDVDVFTADIHSTCLALSTAAQRRHCRCQKTKAKGGVCLAANKVRSSSSNICGGARRM